MFNTGDIVLVRDEGRIPGQCGCVGLIFGVRVWETNTFPRVSYDVYVRGQVFTSGDQETVVCLEWLLPEDEIELLQIDSLEALLTHHDERVRANANEIYNRTMYPLTKLAGMTHANYHLREGV